MSDLNKIIAFQQIIPYLSEDEQVHLAETLGMDLAEIQKRLIGKNKEDEFILMLLLMDVCRNISAFDEGVSQLLHTATSDLLIEMKNGQKFLLEIKHTDKDYYSISSGNLEKRINYATTLGFDLYFAISIKGYWMLFNSEYLVRKNGKIDISDAKESKLDSIIGCISYVFPKNIRIKSVYTNDEKVKSAAIKFPPYGQMVSYEFYYGNYCVFRVKGKNSRYLVYTMILEALQDRLSMDVQTIEHDGNFTIINESFSKEFNVISEYKFLLSPIEHIINNGEQKYTAHTYIEQAKENSNLLNNRFQKEHIRSVMKFLASKGVNVMCIENNKIYKI